MDKAELRGLLHIAGWTLIGWGSLAALLGIGHAFFGEPEANYFSPEKWQFVTQEQWLRWSGFEVTYGLACIGTGIFCREAAKKIVALYH